MATLQDLRAHFGASSDEEAIRKAAERFRIDPVEVAKEVGYDLGGKWGNRLGASVDSYQANLYGLGEAITGSDWLRRQRQSNEASAGLQRDIARSQGAVSSYKDVDSIGDGLDYLGGLAVDSLPYAGEALLGGLGAARLAGRGLQSAIQAGRAADAGVDVVRAGQAAERALATRSTLGGVAASYPSSVGDILSNQREASPDGHVDLLSAAIGGVPYAALNAFGIEGALARRSLARGVGEGSGLRRLGRSIGATALVEGAAETGQELVNQGFGRMAVDPNAGLFDADALERYGESFVGGAALGGAFGSVGGWRQSRQAADQQQLQSAADGDWQRAQVAIEVAEKQRELDLLNRRPDFELESPRATGLPAPAWNPLADSADWGEGGISGEQYDLFNPNGTPTYAANPDGPMAAVAGVREQLGQAPQLGPGLIDELAGVVAPPTPQARTARAADFTAASNEPGQRYVDADGIEHVGTRGMDYDRQTGVLEEIQRRAAEDRAADDRARTILGSGAGQKAIGLARRLIALRDAGVIDENQYVDSAALLTNSKFPAVTKFIEAQEQRASQQPVVPGSTGAPGSPVAGQGDQPGRGAGTARPVAGGGVAEPDVGAELADAGGETNPTLVGAGAVGAAGARPTELSLPDRINAIAASDPDAPVAVRVKGKEKTITRSQMADKLRKALNNPKHRAILEAAMMRVEGRKLGGEEIAAYVTRVTGESYTKQSVDEFLGGLGLTLGGLDQLGAAGVDTVTEEELGMGAGTEDATYRTAETLGDAASDGVIDEGLTSAQKKLKADADTLLSDTRTKAERTQGNLDAALAGDVAEEERAANRLREVRQTKQEIETWLRSAGSRDSVVMAGNDWEEMRSPNGPEWDTLPAHVKYQWTVAHSLLSSWNATIEDFEGEVRDFEKAYAAGELDDSPAKRASDALTRSGGARPERGELGEGVRPQLAGGVSEEALGEVDGLGAIGDGTRAQGVKIERKGAKAPKVRDYAHLSGVELTDTIEVDGASTVMRMKADEELKRLDKLEDDLNAIIACVKGIG